VCGISEQSDVEFWPEATLSNADGYATSL